MVLRIIYITVFQLLFGCLFIIIGLANFSCNSKNTKDLRFSGEKDSIAYEIQVVPASYLKNEDSDDKFAIILQFTSLSKKNFTNEKAYQYLLSSMNRRHSGLVIHYGKDSIMLYDFIIEPVLSNSKARLLHYIEINEQLKNNKEDIILTYNNIFQIFTSFNQKITNRNFKKAIK